MRLLTGLLAATLLLVASPADADTWTKKDRTGDVRSFTYSEKPPPCGTYTETPQPDDETTDIIALTVAHGVDAVVVEIAMRKVRPQGRFSADVNVRTDGPDFELSFDRYEPGGEITTFMAKEPKPIEPNECGMVAYGATDLGCTALTGESDGSSDTLRLTIPRSCLKNPAWVRVGASVYSIGKPWRFDIWGRAKDRPKNNLLVGPLGPRVHAEPPV